MEIQRCCLFGRVWAKISECKLKRVYATRNTSIPDAYGEDFNAFFDLNHC
jgi:hypothetical protein